MKEVSSKIEGITVHIRFDDKEGPYSVYAVAGRQQSPVSCGVSSKELDSSIARALGRVGVAPSDVQKHIDQAKKRLQSAPCLPVVTY